METILDGRFQASIAGSILVPIFQFLYGEGDLTLYIMLALAVFIALDWLSGSSAAKKDGSYGSDYGIDGIKRTFFMVILPVGGNFIDQALGIPSVFFGLLAGGLLYHTINSATANAIRAGWGRWIPESALNLLMNWVKSELESKAKRSLDRKKEKGKED